MGINGLLPALKPIAKQVHISKYKGQRAAVDGYSWLHKGAYCCARELCEGSWTDKFVTYFISRVQLLRSNGVEPVVVFDGGRLPIKGQEEQTRHRARKENREKAAAHLAAGNIAAAVECYQRCVDITPKMAKQVIEELKVQGTSFIVAPYEADAQMAYLAKRGDVQLVLTEDSDLLAYGCPRVLYKLDRSGTGEEVSISDLPNCSSLPLSSFTSDQFLQLCVMAGCDFLAQLPGIGLKKAHGLLRKYQSFTKVLKMLKFNGTKVTPEYEARFQMALWAFRHCRVYCPSAKALQHLAPLPAGGIGAADVDVPAALKQLEQEQQQQQLDFLGPELPQDIAQGIAEGRLDPNSHKPFDLAAIYAGCRKLPPHIAAQLNAASGAVPHLLGYNQSQHGGASSHGAVPGGPRSGAAGAAVSGVGRSSSGRVGLSRKHAGRGQQKLSWAAAKGSAAGAEALAAASAAVINSARKKATLGIAKFFSAPGAANAAVVQQPGSIAATAAPAAAEPAAQPAAPAHNMQNSIRQALHALRQQQQQRQQQEQAEKQQLLSEIRDHEHQAAAATPAATDDPATSQAAADVAAIDMPAAKRQRIDLEAEHQLTPSVELMYSSEGRAAPAAVGLTASDTSLLLDQHQHQQQQQQCLQFADSNLGYMGLPHASVQQQQAAAGMLGHVQWPMAGDRGLQSVQGQDAFLQGLGDSGVAAALAAASRSSDDGFGPAAAAVPVADLGVLGSSDQQSAGLGSLPSTGLSSDLAVGDGHIGTGIGASLGSSMNGSLGLSNSSMDPSLDSSLGLPAASGGTGAAVSALTALFKGVQHRPLPAVRLRTARKFFGHSGDLGLHSEDDVLQQQQNMLGSCPSGGMLGADFTAAVAAGSLSEDRLGSAGCSSQGLGSCGISSDIGNAGALPYRQLGSLWPSGTAGNCLGSSSSFMTPQLPEQQEGEEDEVISPPRPHDLALRGSSSQPWKRLQQSLRGIGGLRSGPEETLEPIQPGSSLQGLRAQLGLRAKRSRLSNHVNSSPDEEGSDMGLGGSLSDGLLGNLGQMGPAADAGEVPAGCSMGNDDLDDLRLGQPQQQQQQQQLQQKRRCSGFFGEAPTQQKPVRQQQQGDYITIPDSEDEGDQAGSAAEAAAAAEAGRDPQGGVTGGSSTDGSSLDASNDENATPDIHSIAHIRKYARLATKVVDKVQQQQQQTQQQQSQQQKLQRSPLRASGAVENSQAAAALASQKLSRNAAKQQGLTRGSNQLAKGSRAKQRPGQHQKLAAGLASLKYDPSMFVAVQPLADDLIEQRSDLDDVQIDSSCGDVGVSGAQTLGSGLRASRAGLGRQASRAGSMFGSKGGTVGALAAKPFKAPWMIKKAADSGDGCTGERALAGIFGTFESFACQG